MGRISLQLGSKSCQTEARKPDCNFCSRNRFNLYNALAIPENTALIEPEITRPEAQFFENVRISIVSEVSSFVQCNLQASSTAPLQLLFGVTTRFTILWRLCATLPATLIRLVFRFARTIVSFIRVPRAFFFWFFNFPLRQL